MSIEMKDSGIDWIGEIPKHWSLTRLKFMLHGSLQYGANESGVLYDESLPRYVRITDIQDNSLREDITKLSLTEEQANGFILKNNDILFARSGATVGKAFIYKESYGKCAFAGYLIKASVNENNDARFVYHYTQGLSYDEWKKQVFIQATIQNIGADKYAQLPLPLPTKVEQSRIANYLDKKCAEIDELIALQEQMIAQLTTYKQAFITETVTKGLDPNVKMKDSGVEWIGEIPEHWSICRVKNISKTNSGSTPRNISGGDDSNIIWIRTTDINDDIVYDSSLHLSNSEFESASCPMLPIGTCLVAMYGGGGTIGKCGVIGKTATINQALCSMEVTEDYNYFYLYNILRAVRKYWMKFAVGTRKDPNINQDVVNEMWIPFPSSKEQQSIANYLDQKCKEIDELISIKKEKIEQLKAYKKSVIYEYVTGKKQVLLLHNEYNNQDN